MLWTGAELPAGRPWTSGTPAAGCMPQRAGELVPRDTRTLLHEPAVSWIFGGPPTRSRLPALLIDGRLVVFEERVDRVADRLLVLSEVRRRRVRRGRDVGVVVAEQLVRCRVPIPVG